jgi:uncharacterized protein YidB (DUF937 family)
MFKILWMILGLFGVKNPLSLDVLQKVLGAVSSQGLGSILNLLTANGMGDMVKSWLSNGPNPKISKSDLIKGLGESKLQELAKEAGVSEDQLAATLSKALPGLVDKLSPDGTLQEHGWLEKAVDFFKAHVH